MAATVLADRLSSLGIDAIYSSPYARAVATIEPFAQRSGFTVTIEPRLRERTLSARPIDDFMDHIRRSFDNPDHRAPGGESLRETGDRALQALAEIALKRHNLAVAVSHGNLMAAVLRSVNQGFGYREWGALKNPDLFKLEFSGATLVSYQPLTNIS